MEKWNGKYMMPYVDLYTCSRCNLLRIRAFIHFDVVYREVDIKIWEHDLLPVTVSGLRDILVSKLEEAIDSMAKCEGPWGAD